MTLMVVMIETSLVLVLSWQLVSAAPGPIHMDTTSLQHIANVSYAADRANPSGLIASIFYPRMDFEQWRPLTGRGDPLRNDPTYDYEPPVLERVHYWADDTRVEREQYPERKSEVLMLGVSSRKPSVVLRQPPRRHHRPPPLKYEDFSYKLSDHYPMTILVPPPPPPPGHKPTVYNSDAKPWTNSQITITDPPKLVLDQDTTTHTPEQLTSLYALQESNLIYQSSTTSQNWIVDNMNQSKPSSNNAVSSDYSGWGPTTPIDEYDDNNDTRNLISVEHTEIHYQPYSFYKPMLSEAPPPPQVTSNPLLHPTFVPTALPSLPSTTNKLTLTQSHTRQAEPTTEEDSTFTQKYSEDTTTEIQNSNTHSSTLSQKIPTSDLSIFDMLNPMLSMPLVNGPETFENHLYAQHASENKQVNKQHHSVDSTKLETMQTMQPPPTLPVTKQIESTSMQYKQPIHMDLNRYKMQNKNPSLHTHDPYLHMRFTTPMPSIASNELQENVRSTTEAVTLPLYLIIQGHSKVKTYGSSPKTVNEDNETVINEIPEPNDTNVVKHLHTLKSKYAQMPEKADYRKSRALTLKSLIDEGRGSIEIQETDLGIKYDVSDGSKVPVEIYRKGIVDNEENNYKQTTKTHNGKRNKRQVDLEDLLPFDEDTLEEYVYNFLKQRRNETGLTGIIAQAVTGEAIDVEEDDDSNEDR